MRIRTNSFAACLVICLSVASLGARAATNPISIKDFSFSPASVTIVAGDNVGWTYRVGDGTAPHTVTAQDSSWDSGNIAPGGSFNRSFARAGTYAYVCTYHPDLMTGVIRVEDARASTPASGGVSVVATQQSDPGPRSQRAPASTPSPKHTAPPSPSPSQLRSAEGAPTPTASVPPEEDTNLAGSPAASGGDSNVLIAIAAFLLLAGTAGAITATVRGRRPRPPA